MCLYTGELVRDEALEGEWVAGVVDDDGDEVGVRVSTCKISGSPTRHSGIAIYPPTTFNHRPVSILLRPSESYTRYSQFEYNGLLRNCVTKSSLLTAVLSLTEPI